MTVGVFQSPISVPSALALAAYACISLYPPLVHLQTWISRRSSGITFCCSVSGGGKRLDAASEGDGPPLTRPSILGFDAVALERRYRLTPPHLPSASVPHRGVALNKDMFNKPNAKGMQIVLYFLFDVLEPETTKKVVPSPPSLPFSLTVVLWWVVELALRSLVACQRRESIA
jgi:hypothetical protein